MARIRSIPAQHGTDDQTAIDADLAARLYVPLLTPDFVYVHWRDLYELSDLVPVYGRLAATTDTFVKVSEDDLTTVLMADPAALRVLRLITGLLTQEFAVATIVPAEELKLKPLTVHKVKGLEASKARRRRNLSLGLQRARSTR